MKHSELFKRSEKVSPGGVHSPVRAFKGVGGPPRFIESAKGSKLRDVEGKEYVDFCMSWGPLILGHQDPDVSEAVKSALSKGWSFGAAETISLELAEFITTEIPWVEKIRFVNSGTEAVMSALRLARGFTARNRVIKFEGCYHGHVDSMLVKAGSGLAEMPSPDSAGVSKQTASETIVVPLDNETVLKKAFEKHAKEIAAVIIEPLPANNGLLPQRKEFLALIADLCQKNGSLLIFDEVISGFRVGFTGMAGDLNIRPDLVTYGKVIGGGFPVGAFGGRAEVLDLMAPRGPVYQAGTLSANPIAMTAGLETLRKLKRTNPYSELEQRVSELGKRIETALPIKVQSKASIFWMAIGGEEIIRNPSQFPAQHADKYKRAFHQLLDKGFYLAPSAFEVGFLSTAHSQEELEGYLSALTAAFEKA